MWTILAFVSALCLGCYDISKKAALRSNSVVDVLTVSICVSAIILAVPLLVSRCAPQMLEGTLFYVPEMSLKGHLFTLLKSLIVLSSWIFAYMSLKHLPISVVSPMQATRPMWTLVGALLLFNERLNIWQWAGVLFAIGTVFVFSFRNRNEIRREKTDARYYVCLVLAILIGACSGLYDKYLMRRFDHNAVQVYYTLYQAVMMLVIWFVHKVRHGQSASLKENLAALQSVPAVILISVFLIISDNVYMLALSDPDSLIAVVSTIRRGGAVIGFAYGLLFLKEKDPLHKILCMAGICAGLICLAIGSV
jgi:transporter family protein